MNTKQLICLASALCLALAGCGKTEVKTPEQDAAAIEEKKEKLREAHANSQEQTDEQENNAESEPAAQEVPQEETAADQPASDETLAAAQPEESQEIQAQSVQTEVVQSQTGGPDTVNGIPIINKSHPVASWYAPGEDPQAVASLYQLIGDMQAQGLDVSNAYSGFRSYETQASLYNNYVASSGQAAADTFSARPGYSEHQSGLAFDLKNWSGALLETPVEAQWLLDHAHEYGFIVRYQAGWEDITGYMAEPWHLRYVGSIAPEIRAANVPLETYLNLGPSQYAQ